MSSDSIDAPVHPAAFPTVNLKPTPRVFANGDTAAVAHFDEWGWVLTATLDESEARLVQHWVDVIAGWADDAGDWLHYREQTTHGPRLCRSENFVPFHDGMRSLLTSGAMVATASLLLGEPALLYKEKINYKLAGGAGYAPHQDAPAYPFVASHVSCMVAVDSSDATNGCLEVVSGRHQELLAMDDCGCIAEDVVAEMSWMPVALAAGQTLWFHSLTPHRSGPNTSDVDRRALYPTYNAASAGDLREEYYRTKLAQIADQGGSDRVVVSLIGDFQGKPVE
jgi:Phytanoyl-CoA dioxygenase (PhyH)